MKATSENAAGLPKDRETWHEGAAIARYPLTPRWRPYMRLDMLPLQCLAEGCFALSPALAPPRVEGECYLSSTWHSGNPPRIKEGEVLLELGDFQEVVFTTATVVATFYGKLDHVKPAIPKYAIVRTSDFVPLLQSGSRERLWVHRSYLPRVVGCRLGAVRLNDFHFLDDAVWFRPDQPLSTADVQRIGYHFVSDDVALAPIDRAVPIHDLPERGVVFDAQHFVELERFGVKGITAVSLTRKGLRLSEFTVMDPAAAAAVLPWVARVARGTTIRFDWPFRHRWRLGVAIDDLGSLQGNLGECICDDGVLWIDHEHLRLRRGRAPLALIDHPTVRRRWLLTSPEVREKEFITVGRARRTHITRGLNRYELIEGGSIVSQLHHRKDDLTLARERPDLSVRK